MKQRMDNWTGEEDLYLAKRVLEYIRLGETQRKAFESIAEELNRTAAAVSFRWSHKLKKKYEEMVEDAKKYRLELIKMQKKITQSESEETEEVVSVNPIQSKETLTLEVTEQDSTQKPLKSKSGYEDILEKLETVFSRITELENENEMLRKERQQMQEKLDGVHQEYREMHDDYEIMNNILKRAMEMMQTGGHSTNDSITSHHFKVDKSGKIERFAN